MYLSAEGTTAYDLPRNQTAHCPECRSPLVPKRGPILVWHFAHPPESTCPNRHGESQWHLLNKAYYHQQGWKIEHPFPPFRCDAFNPDTDEILEFVHSPNYLDAPKLDAIPRIVVVLHGEELQRVGARWSVERVDPNTTLRLNWIKEKTMLAYQHHPNLRVQLGIPPFHRLWTNPSGDNAWIRLPQNRNLAGWRRPRRWDDYEPVYHGDFDPAELSKSPKREPAFP